MSDDTVSTEPPTPDRTVATYRWTDDPDAEIDDSTRIDGGRLIVSGRGPSSIHGYTPHEAVERDVVVDVVADLTDLADDEGFGLFVRRNAPDRYIGARIFPGGSIAIGAFDGSEEPLAMGPLAEGMILHRGRNRITVAAVGPSITLSLNAMVATSVLVDARFVDGYVGLLVEQRHDSAADVAVEWLQVRHIW